MGTYANNEIGIHRVRGWVRAHVRVCAWLRRGGAGRRGAEPRLLQLQFLLVFIATLAEF